MAKKKPELDEDSLGQRLRRVRKALGYTAADVDVLAGLTSGHTKVLEWRSSKNPSPITVESVARALRVNANWLMYGLGKRERE